MRCLIHFKINLMCRFLFKNAGMKRRKIVSPSLYAYHRGVDLFKCIRFISPDIIFRVELLKKSPLFNQPDTELGREHCRRCTKMRS